VSPLFQAAKSKMLVIGYFPIVHGQDLLFWLYKTDSVCLGQFKIESHLYFSNSEVVEKPSYLTSDSLLRLASLSHVVKMVSFERHRNLENPECNMMNVKR
jgi:hypothetical protein